MAKFTLSPEQDGLGYYYGRHIADDGTTTRVDILPPTSHPRPYFVMSSDGMHETDWIVYADGEEIGRVSRREDIDNLVAQKLITP